MTPRYVVAFNGSPRPDGNTRILLEKALEPIRAAGIEAEIVQVGGHPIHGCLACYKCMELQNQRCIMDHDIINTCLEKMIRADAILFGSPTYFADMTPEMKALIDRSGFVAFANNRLFNRKIGASVAVQRRGGATNTFNSMNQMFLMSGMILPGSTYWNLGVGLEKGSVVNDSEAMDNMTDLGQTIVWLIERLRSDVTPEKSAPHDIPSKVREPKAEADETAAAPADTELISQ